MDSVLRPNPCLPYSVFGLIRVSKQGVKEMYSSPAYNFLYLVSIGKFCATTCKNEYIAIEFTCFILRYIHQQK